MTYFTDFTSSREALLLVLLGVTLQLHKAKVIVYRSCCDLFLLVQYSTRTIGLALSCNFKKLKVFIETKLSFYDIIFASFINLNYRIVASTSPSRIEVHAGLFRSLMKAIFDPYVL